MLNAERIRQRRRDLHRPVKLIAKEIGVTGPVITRMEEGRNHEWFTLGELQRLAEGLSMEFGELFDDEVLAPPAPPEAPAQRVADLGRLLQEIKGLTPRSGLCKALECSPDELEEALAQLSAVLRPAGMTVYRQRDRVSIEPLVEKDSSQMKEVLRDRGVRNGLAVNEANLIARAALGVGPPKNISPPENVAFQRLRKSGIIDQDGPGLTPEAEYSLLLADPEKPEPKEPEDVKGGE